MRAIKRLNKAISLEIILLAGFAVFFIRAAATGSVSLYVHPRVVPFIIFAAIAMLIIALVRVGDLFRSRHDGRKALPLIFFIIPLVMAFTIPPQSFDSTTGTLGDIRLSSEMENTAGQSDEKPSEQGAPSDDERSGTGTEDQQDNSAEEQANEGSPVRSALIMDTDNFVQCLSDVSGDLESYIGMPIEILGFVYHDEQFKADEFVTARLMMVCCAADMQPVGFLCRYDGAETLKSDSWITVNGVIGKTEFNGETIPYVKVDHIDEAQKPDQDYIYPY